MYADYEFYTDTYGGTAITTEAAYNAYAEKASYFIDFVVRGHLTDNLPTDTDALKKIRMCCAALSDQYKEIDDIKSASASTAAGGGIIASMSSGGESVTLKQSALQTALASGEKAVRQYLMQTVSMYLAGVADDDGRYYLYWGI